jgi:hypothetical protein
MRSLETIAPGKVLLMKHDLEIFAMSNRRKKQEIRGGTSARRGIAS